MYLKTTKTNKMKKLFLLSLLFVTVICYSQSGTVMRANPWYNSLKTINGQSLFGHGNLVIGGSGGLTLQMLHDTVYTYKRPYKVYTALLTQSGTNAPTATILENTIGTVTFTYLSTGNYRITTPGGFIKAKTWLTPVNASAFDQNTNSNLVFSMMDDGSTYNELILGTETGWLDLNHSNGLLDSFPIEIRVYP